MLYLNLAFVCLKIKSLACEEKYFLSTVLPVTQKQAASTMSDQDGVVLDAYRSLHDWSTHAKNSESCNPNPHLSKADITVAR